MMKQWKCMIMTALFFLLSVPALYAVQGDVNGIKGVELGDAIAALQIVAGMQTEAVQTGDVNKDSRIGPEEAVFVLQFLANLRLITHTNSLGMTFSYIPAGSFVMGSPVGEPGRYADETQHEVSLSKAFFMQTTEVTQKQWTDLMGSNPSDFSTCGDECPVENVSWDKAQNFIAALNQLGEGTYRLPTEAEWEYAARAGSTTAFANGQITQTQCTPVDPVLDVIGWYCGNANDSIHPVAAKQANRWGLYDMYGNVMEWCQDWYGTYPAGPVTDPAGPATGSGKVVRGGSFNYAARFCRSATRSGYPAGFFFNDIGFRVVREAE